MYDQYGSHSTEPCQCLHREKIRRLRSFHFGIIANNISSTQAAPSELLDESSQNHLKCNTAFDVVREENLHEKSNFVQIFWQNINKAS
jgi:hypothetical protein